eukprot:jgi/Mesen1/2461/ME000158S01657
MGSFIDEGDPRTQCWAQYILSAQAAAFLPASSFFCRSFLSNPAGQQQQAAPPAAPLRPITKILVANRGEIACRVIKTARQLGVQTVAVFSDADREALHVKGADEAVGIGPAPSAQSYLRADAILAAAERTGAQGMRIVHESANFLDSLASAKREAMASFGDERVLVERYLQKPRHIEVQIFGDKHGNVVHLFERDCSVQRRHQKVIEEAPAFRRRIGEAAVNAAKAVGYVSAGTVEFIVDVDSGAFFFMEMNTRLQTYTGNILIALNPFTRLPSLYAAAMKRQYRGARLGELSPHIFGDKHGNVVHLFERDCSVQRRHQKVIEEAPAFRRRIGEAAVNAAKAVGYVSAGTVEFIVDVDSGAFFFMEMNTRLQVEHPVTEMITRQDLVEWQLRVAAGERLPLLQPQLHIHGHAFEARVYAENVPRGFLPAAGLLRRCRPPTPSSTGEYPFPVCQRAAALAKLHSCLADYQVAGVPTNIPFLKALAAHPAFVAADVDTHFIARFHSDLIPAPPAGKEAEGEGGQVALLEEERKASLAATVAAAGICTQDRWRAQSEGLSGLASVWSSGSGFRLNHLHCRPLTFATANEAATADSALPISELAVTYSRDGSFQTYQGGGASSPLQVSAEVAGPPDGGDMTVQVDGVRSPASLCQYTQGALQHTHLWLHGDHHHFTSVLPQYPADAAEHHHGHSGGGDHSARGQVAAAGKGSVLTPMAGRVVKVVAATGQPVRRGDPVVVLEAMKMEHVVTAPTAGVVADLAVAAGQQVADGSVLFRIQAAESSQDPGKPSAKTG